MLHDPQSARLALLEEASRRQPSAALLHTLARLRLDSGDGPSAAAACARAVELGGEGVRIEPVIAASGDGFYPPEVQVQRARTLMEHGFITSVVISQLGRAALALNDQTTIQWLMDYARFFRSGPYDGARRLPLRRIADIFLASPAWYAEPADRAIRNASRYDAISETSESPEIADLARTLRKAAGEYIASLRDGSGDWHPFTASIPVDFAIEAWGVISGRTGYHQSHIHPRAWASGVIYLVAPNSAANSTSRVGWLRVGPPEDLKGGWEEQWIQPAAGLLVMFPAYFTHETLPMEIDEERICVAFDIVPR